MYKTKLNYTLDKQKPRPGQTGHYQYMLTRQHETQMLIHMYMYMYMIKHFNHYTILLYKQQTIQRQTNTSLSPSPFTCTCIRHHMWLILKYSITHDCVCVSTCTCISISSMIERNQCCVFDVSRMLKGHIASHVTFCIGYMYIV